MAWYVDIYNPPYDSSDAPLSGRYFLLLQGPQSHFSAAWRTAWSKKGRVSTRLISVAATGCCGD